MSKFCSFFPPHKLAVTKQQRFFEKHFELPFFAQFTYHSMAKEKSKQKEIARILYLQDYRQKDIADKLGVAENTVCRWAKTEAWDSLKKNLLNSKYQRLAELYNELEEFNRMIKEKDGYKVANSKEADARRKLITDISELETKYNIGQVTSIARDFVHFVGEIDFDFSQRTLSYFEAFVEQQIEKQKWQRE